MRGRRKRKRAEEKSGKVKRFRVDESIRQAGGETLSYHNLERSSLDCNVCPDPECFNSLARYRFD